MPDSPGDGEETRLRLLVEKLSHALPDVQLRALRNLRHKFSAGLMSPEFLAHEAGLHKSLVELVADARESIRGDALLFVAEIFSRPGLSSCKAGLIESGLVRVLREGSIQGESLAIAQDIQRAVLLLGGTTLPEKRPGVDEAKSSAEGGKGHATSYSSPPRPREEDISCLDSPLGEGHHTNLDFVRSANAAGADGRRDVAPPRMGPAAEDGEGERDNLLSDGWCFPIVELGRANEKKLFEFQVRFGLRQDSESLLSSCRIFRHELLEDFPPEVFLQRPQVLRQLLAMARLPQDLMLPSTTSSHPPAVDAAPRPSVLALKSLKCLHALALRLSASLMHHTDPSFKPPPPQTVPPRGPPSQELSSMRLLRYPQRPGESVPGALSLPGFALLVMETLLPLSVWRDNDESSASRLPPRALALVSLLLPHLCASSLDTEHDHLEQRVVHLLHCVAPLLRNPLPGPLVLVAVRLLHLLPSPPAALPSAITDLLPHAVPHYPWLGPFLQALDPEAFAVATVAHDLLQDASALFPLTQHPYSSHGPLRPAMLRLQAAVPLLALLPNVSLIARGVQFWALASLQVVVPAHAAGAPREEQGAQCMAEGEAACLGNEVVLRLLDLPLLCNRRAAYQEFARTVAVDDDEGTSGERVGPIHVRKRLLKKVLLSEETRGLLWVIMARGLQDEDVAIKQAAWEVARAVATSVFDEQDEGDDQRGPVACAALELLPLLMAAREEGREGETMSIKAELMNKVVQVLLPLVPLSSPAALLPLFSHSSAHRLSALTALHAQLLPSLPHDAIPVSVAVASSPPPQLPITISAPSPFSPSDMKALCDLIGSSSLEPSLRETAAYQLDSMLGTLRNDQEGVREAVMYAVTSLTKAGHDGLDVAASVLLLRSATLHPDLPLSALLAFLPLLFHPSGCLRFAVQAALSRSLFCNLQHWMPASALLKPVLGTSPAPTLTRVPSPSGLLVLSLPSPSPPAQSPLIPSFLLAFKLPSPAPASSGPHPTLLLRPTVPLPSLAPASFTPLVMALSTGWARISSVAPASTPSPLPALIEVPAREVNACISALRHADSFRAFSLSLYRLHSSVCLGGPPLSALMENDMWLQAISKLLQAPPRTSRDDRLLLDALLFIEQSIVPKLRPREAAVLTSAALDALLPVLQLAFSPGEKTIHGDAAADDAGTGYKGRADLCNAILSLFLSLLLHLPSSSATAYATRSPLLPLLLKSLQDAHGLHSSTLHLSLAVVTHLWPFAAQTVPVPLPPYVASIILRLAARHHDPEAFHGSAVTKAGLLCLRVMLCHGPSSDGEARGLWAPSPEASDGASTLQEGLQGGSHMLALLPGPEGLFRFLSDRHSEVRALCYGCLAEVAGFPSTLSRLVDQADGDSAVSEEDGASSLVGTVLRVAADRTEPPLVAAEATRFLAALLQAHLRQVESGSPGGRPGRWLSDARLESVMTLVAEVLGPRTSASNATRVAVTLELLRWVLVVARDEGLWTGIIVEGAVYDCHLASGQLVWRPEVLGRLIRLVAEGTQLRGVYRRQVTAALGVRGATTCAQGYFADGEAKGPTDARGKGWVSDLVHAAMTQGGEHEVMRAQTQALELLTLLLAEEQGAKRVLQECEGATHAVLGCLADYAVLAAFAEASPTSGTEASEASAPAVAEEEGLPGPSSAETTKPALQESASLAAYSATHAQLLKAACGCAYQLFVSADVELYLPLPSTMPLRLLEATTRMLHRMEAGSPPVKQALSLLLIALTKRRFQQVLQSPTAPAESVADALVRALWGCYVPAMTRFLAIKSPSSALSGGDGVGSDDYRHILSHALSVVLAHTPAAIVDPVATEMVSYLNRRLRDLSAMLTLDDIMRHTDESAPGGAEVRQTTHRTSASRGRRGLQALNERLGSTRGNKTPSSPSGTRATGLPTRQELTALLGVYRSLLLACPAARVSAARQGLPGILLRLWPYALSSEVDGPSASSGRRETLTTSTYGDHYQVSHSESTLQVMLGIVRNILLPFPADAGVSESNVHGDGKGINVEAEGREEACRRAVLAVTSRGEEALKNDISGRAGDTLATLTLKVSARTDVRPEVTEAAMAVLAALALAVGGRKLFIQSPFLSNTCAPVLHKALRRQGNRLSRLSELCSLDSNGRVVLAVMKFLAHLTLSAEGQKLLVQMSGFSDLFEDLLTVLRQPLQEGEPDVTTVALDMMVQVCCILRNLSFLRGIKSRVLSSNALLSFLLHSMTHPAPTVRLPSSVAVWSLLYHSEKSRGALKVLYVQDTLHKAEHMAAQESEVRGGSEILAGLRRSLNHIRALLDDDAPPM